MDDTLVINPPWAEEPRTTVSPPPGSQWKSGAQVFTHGANACRYLKLRLCGIEFFKMAELLPAALPLSALLFVLLDDV
jgi:hypothetical protein